MWSTFKLMFRKQISFRGKQILQSLTFYLYRTIVLTFLCICLHACSAPIHEVTTNFSDPPVFVDAVHLRKAGGASNPPDYRSSIRRYGFTIDVASAQKKYFPKIKTLHISGIEYNYVFAIILAEINLLNWTLIASDPALGRIEAYDTTKWFGFIDDVVVRASHTEDGILIDIRSKSRNGFIDFGKNGNRVSKFLNNIKNSLY